MAARSEAGGPLLIGRDGTPRRWSTGSSLELNPDRGGLGAIQDPVTLVQHASDQWNGVATAALRITIGDSLESDVEDLTESEFNSLITRNDGTNPIIFDTSGAIFREIYGEGSGVIGLAGPSLVATSTGMIVKGFAMFNGEDVVEGDREIFKAVVTHEIGHLINLEHSQINGNRIGGAIPGFQGLVSANNVETMFPILIQSSLKPHPMSTLHRDDIAAFSALYPSQEFLTFTAGISGIVFNVDGETHLQGVNVVARNANHPFDDAVSYVSGLLVDPASSTAPPALRGAFHLQGLTPGEPYKVYIEEISSSFRGGARVGPLDPPLDLDFTQTAAFLEFWNGAGESAENPPDDPLQGEVLSISAGARRRPVDFVFNGVKPRVTRIDPGSGSYLQPQEVIVQGANFVEAATAQLRGSNSVPLVAVKVRSTSVLEATVPDGALPAEYEVFVTSHRGESAPSGVMYTVTEPVPELTSAQPEALENDRPGSASVRGSHLLGTRSARLRRQGFPDFDLALLRVLSASQIVVEVPAGLVPGRYQVHVTNTAGESAAGPATIFVLELEPVLSAETEPPTARNSASKDVRVLGENLAGTTAVSLLNGTAEIPLVIVSTSLSEVVVTVPGGLDPGTYTVRLTNSEGSVTGPALFRVKKASGGGGGCGASVPGGGPGPSAGFFLAALIVIRTFFARRRREAFA